MTSTFFPPLPRNREPVGSTQVLLPQVAASIRQGKRTAPTAPVPGEKVVKTGEKVVKNRWRSGNEPVTTRWKTGEKMPSACRVTARRLPDDSAPLATTCGGAGAADLVGKPVLIPHHVADLPARRDGAAENAGLLVPPHGHDQGDLANFAKDGTLSFIGGNQRGHHECLPT